MPAPRLRLTGLLNSVRRKVIWRSQFVCMTTVQVYHSTCETCSSSRSGPPWCRQKSSVSASGPCAGCLAGSLAESKSSAQTEVEQSCALQSRSNVWRQSMPSHEALQIAVIEDD